MSWMDLYFKIKVLGPIVYFGVLVLVVIFLMLWGVISHYIKKFKKKIK